MRVDEADPSRSLIKNATKAIKIRARAHQARVSPVAKAIRSEHAKAKDATKLADDGSPLHSFRTLLQDLATLGYNITHTHLNPEAKIVTTTRPTPLQAKAFKLLGLNPACTQ